MLWGFVMSLHMNKADLAMLRQHCPQWLCLDCNAHCAWPSVAQRQEVEGVGASRFEYLVGSDLPLVPAANNPNATCPLLLYAEDMVLIADSCKHLLAAMRILALAAEWGMQADHAGTTLTAIATTIATAPLPQPHRHRRAPYRGGNNLVSGHHS